MTTIVTSDLDKEDKTVTDFLLAVMNCDFRLLFFQLMSKDHRLCIAIKLFASNARSSKKVSSAEVKAIIALANDFEIRLVELAENYRRQQAENEATLKAEWERQFAFRWAQNIGPLA